MLGVAQHRPRCASKSLKPDISCILAVRGRTRATMLMAIIKFNKAELVEPELQHHALIPSQNLRVADLHLTRFFKRKLKLASLDRDCRPL